MAEHLTVEKLLERARVALERTRNRPAPGAGPVSQEDRIRQAILAKTPRRPLP